MARHSLRRTWFAFTTRELHLSKGINDAWWLTHKSLARENSDTSPYLIPNEWISAQIAQFLRLPIPPCALMKSGRSKGMFASLKFTGTDTDPDDSRPEVCVKLLPRLCTGILLFDILIANSDRHEGNVAVDDPDKPTRIHVFDHDRAIFGIWDGDGRKRLRELHDRLGCSGGSKTSGNTHCFLKHLDTSEHFIEWIERIERIPKWFLRDICEEVIGCGIKASEARAAFEFLNLRRRGFRDLINSHRDKFESIRTWVMI